MGYIGCYYGISEVRGEETRITVLVDPERPVKKPTHYLTLPFKVPVEGFLVVTIDHDDDGTLTATQIVYDPAPDNEGRWRRRYEGHCPARLEEINRRSIATRILGDPLND